MKHNGKWWIIVVMAVVSMAFVYGVTETWLASKPPEHADLPRISLPPTGTGRVTMIDLGATECIPCKMMAPIIEELKLTYAGKADIVFIDVWKDPEQAKRFGIQVIPTQIFFDMEGKEVFRNTGFLDKQRIVDILSRLGVS